MSYIKPKNVESPKSHWLLKKILYDGGEFKWSAAEGQWKGDSGWEDRLALRWNGGRGGEKGNPQSRGYPTWFIVPRALEEAIRELIEQINSKNSRR